jgi:hypothetical protein
MIDVIFLDSIGSKKGSFSRGKKYKLDNKTAEDYIKFGYCKATAKKEKAVKEKATE